MPRAIALLLALVGAAIWTLLAVTPPAAIPAAAPPELFSAARAQADIRAIAQVPHPVGSAESDRIRAYLVQRLRAHGAVVSEQPVPLPPKSIRRLEKWRGPGAAGTMGRNVIGVLAGSDRRLPAVLLMAHRDSVWGSPGAADDAMGVASALEVLRAIRARGLPRRDLILLFTDAEEIGLDGAHAFFERHMLARHVGVVINLEARGGAGRANMFETGPDNGAMMRLYADRVARPASNSVAILIYDRMPNSTDYTVAKQRGIAGFNIANLGGADLYHSPRSTPDAIDPATVQDMGMQALDLTGALVFASSLPPKRPNLAFSDVIGRMTIAYPIAFGWAPLLLLSGVLIGFALRRQRVGPRSAGAAIVFIVALLLHGGLLLTMLNAVSIGWPFNYYDRLAAIPQLEAIALLGVAATVALAPLLHAREQRVQALVPALLLLGPGLLLGVSLPLVAILSVLAMAISWFLPRTAPDAAAATAGAILLLFGVTTAVQILLPTAGPLLAGALLPAAIGLAARSVLPPLAGLAVSAGMAAIGIGHLAAFAHFTFLAVGPEWPVTMIAYLFAGLPLLRPLLPDRPAIVVAAGALALALGVALWVRFDPMAPGVPAYSLAEGGVKTRE